MNCEHCEEADWTDYYDQGEDFAFWTMHPRFLRVCAPCKSALENREPAERTFDDALGFRCDEQMRLDAARRLK